MKVNKIKAWKDEAYRATLTKDDLAKVNNPVGSIELSDEEMQGINGGTADTYNRQATRNPDLSTYECCQRMF